MIEELISLSYFRYNLLLVLKPVFIILVSVMIFQGLLISAYEAIEGSDFIDFFLQELEISFNTSLEVPRFLLTSPLSYISLSWRHPLVIIMLSFFVISRASSSVAGEREGGYGDLLFTKPIPRWMILGQHVGVTILAIWVISLLKVFGTLFFSSQRGILLEEKLVFQLGLLSFSLYTLVATYSYLFSVLTPVKAKATALATGTTLFFFTLEFMGEFWELAASLESISIFYYYQPFSILLGEGDILTSLFSLTIPALFFIFISFLLIEKRDL